MELMVKMPTFGVIYDHILNYKENDANNISGNLLPYYTPKFTKIEGYTQDVEDRKHPLSNMIETIATIASKHFADKVVTSDWDIEDQSGELAPKICKKLFPGDKKKLDESLGIGVPEGE